ncbi:hypothetical protein RR46_03723 [Papilio xuthus]|uniref:Uncharacterized protein n=1 Tax=Papilio xuthus TaxID=66420 RepID=A0A194PZ25_PAPXU|nr:hypothetical protein RR46_03723 [Papilio xuthus]
MDLTTRRGEDGIGEVGCNGTECREIVNGSQGCEVTGVTVETAPPQRKANSFSIRHLVGAEDSERSADGNVSNEGIGPVRPVKYLDHTEDRRQVEAIPRFVSSMRPGGLI